MNENNDFNGENNQIGEHTSPLGQSNYQDGATEERIIDVETVKSSESAFNEPNKSKKNKKGSMGKFVAGVTIMSLVGGASIGSSFALVNHYYGNNQGTTQAAAPTSTPTGAVSNAIGSNVLPVAATNSITDIANNVGPSVVSIYNTKVVSTIYGDFDQSGLGSGVIFKEDNDKVYMITNSHVVNGASSLAVNFLGDSKVEGTLVGEDTTTDIAVVSVNKSDIPAETLANIKVAPLGDSDNIQVGQLAVAIGTPMEAAFNNTVTAGVISATNREVQVDESRTLTLIQTDAAINPGNSGGALVGASGEVVGINTIKLVDSSVEGMGFAIPINTVKPIIEEILQNGNIVRPSLGIVGRNVSAEASEMYELPIGIMVVQVAKGGSADLAGIEANDILFEFDGTQITDMNQLKGLIANKRVGDQVEVKVVRNKQKKVLTLTLKDVQAQVQTSTTSLY